jgi:hypothetical protein
MTWNGAAYTNIHCRVGSEKIRKIAFEGERERDRQKNPSVRMWIFASNYLFLSHIEVYNCVGMCCQRGNLEFSRGFAWGMFG